MITITIENAWTSDLFVTIWDLNSPTPDEPVRKTERINNGQVSLYDVQEDSRDYGRIRWRAVHVDYPNRSKERSSISCSAGSTVEVDLL